MEIQTQAEVLLREAGYETWSWSGGDVPVCCFENATVIGFLHVFESGEGVRSGWSEAQRVTLAGHAPSLRAAGSKAWNVYAVFLSGDPAPGLSREIERIEEDFALTRKIARIGIRTTADLHRALLPLLPLLGAPVIGAADYTARLRARMKDVPAEAVEAFLGSVDAGVVTRILVDGP